MVAQGLQAAQPTTELSAEWYDAVAPYESQAADLEGEEGFDRWMAGAVAKAEAKKGR